MFALELNAHFSAAHAIVMNGVREPLHGHDWHVTATIEGENLDRDGLLVDFHHVQHALHEIIRPFHNANLNEVPPFTKVNPSAEHVAQHIARELDGALQSWVRERPKKIKSGGPRVKSVRVTEAVGCAAVYFVPVPRTPKPRR
jgi:6-pyruvoyltetrahydropterin/6-carboxytetrahydropterin synthase